LHRAFITAWRLGGDHLAGIIKRYQHLVKSLSASAADFRVVDDAEERS
jgi:hypothetical protein